MFDLVLIRGDILMSGAAQAARDREAATETASVCGTEGEKHAPVMSQ